MPINAGGTRNIAKVCKELELQDEYISARIMCLMGREHTPWEPDCKDYAPLNVYGQTKLDGELAVSGNA